MKNFLKNAWRLVRREPLRTISVVQILIGAGAAFGLKLDPAQEQAGLIVLGVLLGVNEAARNSVTPNVKVEAAGMHFNRPMDRWERK